MPVESRAVVRSFETQPPDAPLRTGLPVRTRGGVVGTLSALVPAWAQRPTHLAIQTATPAPQEIVVPRRWIAEVTADAVVLGVSRRKLARQQPRLTDDDLCAAVAEAVAHTPTLQPPGAVADIQLQVENHSVTLQGNVRTLWRALLAEAVVCQAPGVWDVCNQLIGDDELADNVLATLRRERALRGVRLQVASALGHLTLCGTVATSEHAALAIMRAQDVLGVRSVHSELHVSGSSTAAQYGPPLPQRQRQQWDWGEADPGVRSTPPILGAAERAGASR